MRSAVRTVALLVAVAEPAAQAAPPLVPWEEAGEHVGSVVTVEGRVSAAETVGDACILEFAPGDPLAFRAVLILPMLSRARHPELRYRGQRVRATGRVQRFQGRPEMVLRSDAQIELESETEETPAAPPAPAPPPAAVAPAPAPAPRGLVEAIEQGVTGSASCDDARARWREAAALASSRATALSRCLDGVSYDCGSEREALAPVLTALAESEDALAAACR